MHLLRRLRAGLPDQIDHRQGRHLQDQQGHLHRQTTLGYEGAMQILTTLTNAVLENLDDKTRGMGTTDYNHDLVR